MSQPPKKQLIIPDTFTDASAAPVVSNLKESASDASAARPAYGAGSMASPEAEENSGAGGDAGDDASHNSGVALLGSTLVDHFFGMFAGLIDEKLSRIMLHSMVCCSSFVDF